MQRRLGREWDYKGCTVSNLSRSRSCGDWNGNGTAMAAPCKRTLTYAEFESYAREIYDISERLRDGWELRSMQTTKDSRKTAFLVKKCTKLISLGNESTGSSDLAAARELEMELQWTEADIGDCCDPASTVQI